MFSSFLVAGKWNKRPQLPLPVLYQLVVHYTQQQHRPLQPLDGEPCNSTRRQAKIEISEPTQITNTHFDVQALAAAVGTGLQYQKLRIDASSLITALPSPEVETVRETPQVVSGTEISRSTMKRKRPFIPTTAMRSLERDNRPRKRRHEDEDDDEGAFVLRPYGSTDDMYHNRGNCGIYGMQIPISCYDLAC